MTSPVRGSSLIWFIRLRAASAALALAVVLLLVVVASQSAQAQTYEVLHTFHDKTDGRFPTGGLIRDAAGNLYGTALLGGDPSCFGCGVVFKISPTRNLTTLHAFKGGVVGAWPNSSLIRDAAGNLYGTTEYGGDLLCNGGCGVVFKLSPTGKFTVLHAFTGGSDGASPAGIVRDGAGNLYGTTGRGGDLTCGCGVVFKLSPTRKFTVLHTFTGGTDGGFPAADLILDAAGNLYGAAGGGGDLSACIGVGCGVVFKVDTAGHETVLYDFTGGADGAGPLGVVRDAAGNLYGTTGTGGDLSCSPDINGCGTVFKVDTTGHETVLYSFTGGADGSNPAVRVIRDAAGNLYGTTEWGGGSLILCSYPGQPSGCGVVFKVDTAGNETVLYTFIGATHEAGLSPSRLLRDAAGNLYGTTQFGGDLNVCMGQDVTGCGVVFKLSP